MPGLRDHPFCSEGSGVTASTTTHVAIAVLLVAAEIAFSGVSIFDECPNRRSYIWICGGVGTIEDTEIALCCDLRKTKACRPRLIFGVFSGEKLAVQLIHSR